MDRDDVDAAAIVTCVDYCKETVLAMQLDDAVAAIERD